MGGVAGGPEGHAADEAEQTPSAAAQSQRGPEPVVRRSETSAPLERGEPSAAPPKEADQSGIGTSAGPAEGRHSERVPSQSAEPPGPSAEPPSSNAEPPNSNAEQSNTTAEPPAEEKPQAPGFAERGRMRRRARFLRRARELAYRDLGGLVFDLHRFGQRNDPLVLAKLATLRQIDSEVRELEALLRDRRPVTVLREVGIAACPRCAAIHGSDDRFCPGCGLAFDTNADRPISTAPISSQVHPASQAPPPAMPSAPPAMPSAPPAMPSAPPAMPSAPPVKPSAPPVKPTAPPVAAKSTSPAALGRKLPKKTEEDEPTQILRPPRGDGST